MSTHSLELQTLELETQEELRIKSCQLKIVAMSIDNHPEKKHLYSHWKICYECKIPNENCPGYKPIQ
jgi:hypothetical protein